MQKPTIGFFSLSSCGGCLLQILDSPLIDSMRDKAETLLRDSQSVIDICFVSGSAITAEDGAELADLRKRSKVLVFIGACTGSAVGSVDIKDIRADHVLHGCPADMREIADAVAKLLSGRKPVYRDRPVCADCREKESGCLLQAKVACLGPVTRGGCEAVCTANSTPCIGCRGSCDDGSVDILKRKAPDGTTELLGLMRKEDARTDR